MKSRAKGLVAVATTDGRSGATASGIAVLPRRLGHGEFFPVSHSVTVIYNVKRGTKNSLVVVFGGRYAQSGMGASACKHPLITFLSNEKLGGVGPSQLKERNASPAQSARAFRNKGETCSKGALDAVATGPPSDGPNCTQSTKRAHGAVGR